MKRDWLTRPDMSWLLFVGRRAPGVTLAQVQAAYPTLLGRALAASNPADDGAAETRGRRMSRSRPAPGDCHPSARSTRSR